MERALSRLALKAATVRELDLEVEADALVAALARITHHSKPPHALPPNTTRRSAPANEVMGGADRLRDLELGMVAEPDESPTERNQRVIHFLERTVATA